MTLFVADAGCGRGVFTDRPISAGAVIERAHVIAVPERHAADLARTPLFDYWFTWGERERDAGFATGFGSVYNHSFAPNAAHRKDFGHGVLEFVALCDIPAGREIRIDYTGGGAMDAPLWFTPHAGNTTHAVADSAATARAAEVGIATTPDNGRGVFAARAFAPGETIEWAPVVVLAGSDWPAVAETPLERCCYAWGDRLQCAAFALGCGSLYRAAERSNARIEHDHARRLLRFVAARAIAVGDEITVDSRSAGGEAASCDAR